MLWLLFSVAPFQKILSCASVREGNWIPHPRDVVCSVVDCGPPPMAASGETSVNRPSYIQLTNSHFLPPSAFEDGDPVEAVGGCCFATTKIRFCPF